MTVGLSRERTIRALSVVAMTSVLAPGLFSVLLFGGTAILHPSRGVGAAELVGLTVWAVMLGWLPTMACCVAALCCLRLARRINLTSLPAYAAGGAVMALATWTAIAAGDVIDLSFRVLTDSAEMIVSLAVDGAICGWLWWRITAR